MKVYLIDEIKSYEFEKLVNLEDICIATQMKHNFVSEKFFEFVKYLIKDKKNPKVNVILIDDGENNTKVAIDWITSISKDNNLSMNVLCECDKDYLAKNYEVVKIFALESFIIKRKRISKDNSVVIYTDGACSGNPGPGGWGAILMRNNRKKEISGYEKDTTNNQMELTAVIEALKLLKKPCNVELYSDSAYVVNAFEQGWMDKWKQKRWKNSESKPVKNIELWQCLDALITMHNVTFKKVKGHADNEFNNRCDELATGEIAKHKKD